MQCAPGAVLDSPSLTSHPVHLSPDSPSAFLPYCGFSTSLEELGRPLGPGLTPVCDAATPVLLEGRLCYQLEVSSHVSDSVSFGPNHALMLLVDSNMEKSASVPASANLNKDMGRIEISGDAGSSSAMVYVHTLAGQWLREPGRHAITGVKEVTGTQDFLALRQDQRGGCQLEEREACQAQVARSCTSPPQGYLRTKVEECKCWPQAWPGLRTPEAQVRRNPATVPGPAALHAGGPHLL